MHNDPIVQEVRAARDHFAAAFGYDLDRIFAEIKRLEARHPSRLVRPPRRRAAPAIPAPAASVAEATGDYAVTPKPVGKRRQRTVGTKKTTAG